MATELAVGYITLLPSAKGFKTALSREIGGDLKRAGATAGDDTSKAFGSRFSGGMKKAGKAAAVGLGAAFAGAAVLGKQSIDAASNLEESQSKVNTVFGKGADIVTAWSKTTATGIGQSQQQALDAAGSFGNLFVQLGIGSKTAAGMSTKMVGLASDFASFHNADITEVIDAQSAAFRGEYDSIQKFVPTINAAAVEQKALAMTGKAATKELTAQEKALATQALIMEGAGDAAGDFARTSGGLANQQRILSAGFEDSKAAIGKALLPAMTAVVGFISKSVIPAAQRLAETWMPRLKAGFQAVSDFVRDNWPRVRDIVAGVFEAFGRAWEQYGRPALDAVIGAFQRAVEWVQDKWPQIKQTVMDAFAAIGRAWEQYGRPAMDAVIEAFRDVVSWVRDKWPQIKQMVIDVVTAIANGFREHVLPVLKTFREAGVRAFSWLKDNIAPIATFVAVLGGFFILSKIIAMFGALRKALVFVQLAVVKLNIAMLANPYVLVAAAIAALAAGVVYAYKRFEPFRKIVDAVGRALRTGFQASVKAVVDFVRDNWPKIQKIIGGVFQQVREIITTASGVITRIIKAIVKTVTVIWDRFGDEIVATIKATWRLVSGVIKAAWKAISGIVRGALDVIHGIIKTVMSLIRGDWRKAWEGIKQIFAGVWKAIRGVVDGAIDYVKSVIRAGVDAVKVAWSGLSKIVDFLRDKISAPIRTVVDGMRDRVVEVVRSIVDKVKTAWGGLVSIITFLRERIITPVMNAIGTFKTAFGGAFDSVVRAVKKAWDLLTGVVKVPINFVIGFYNEGIVRVWNAVISKIPTVPELGTIAKLAKGGHVPGSGDRDTVPAMLTPGEFVVTKKAAKAWGPKVLAALNETSGTIDPGVFGYAAGGYARSVDEAKAFALSHKGKPYRFPDVGPNSFDCSGFTSALVNYILGKDPPWFRRHSTGSMGADSALAPGSGGSGSGFVLGVKPPYQTNSQGVLVGHMATTIGGDLNAEGTPPAMLVGAGAKGASSFATQYHLPGYAGLSDADTGVAKNVAGLTGMSISGLLPPLGDLLEKMINKLPGMIFDFFTKKLPGIIVGAVKDFAAGSINLSPEMLAKIQGLATGGRVRRDGPILVGERGPELYWGKQGDRVQPLNRADAGSGGVHVNQIVAADPEAALAVLRREEWRRRAIPVAA